MRLQTIIEYYKRVMKPGFNCAEYAQICAEEVFHVIGEYGYLSHDDETMPEYLNRVFLDMPLSECNAWITDFNKGKNQNV